MPNRCSSHPSVPAYPQHMQNLHLQVLFVNLWVAFVVFNSWLNHRGKMLLLLINHASNDFPVQDCHCSCGVEFVAIRNND